MKLSTFIIGGLTALAVGKVAKFAYDTGLKLGHEQGAILSSFAVNSTLAKPVTVEQAPVDTTVVTS